MYYFRTYVGENGVLIQECKKVLGNDSGEVDTSGVEGTASIDEDYLTRLYFGFRLMKMMMCHDFIGHGYDVLSIPGQVRNT